MINLTTKDAFEIVLTFYQQTLVLFIDINLARYAGTAFIDTVSITKANVKVLEDGDKWLNINIVISAGTRLGSVMFVICCHLLAPSSFAASYSDGSIPAIRQFR